MISNFLAAVSLGLFVMTLLKGIIDALYNIKKGKPTYPYVWITPSIFITLFWLLSH